MSAGRRSPVEPEEVEPQMCSFDMRLDILGRVPFFAGLPRSDVERINEMFHEHGFAPEEAIYHPGDEARRLSVVASGQVKIMRHTLAGQDVLLDILTPGEYFGSLAALGDDVYPDTAQAQTVVCVLGIGAEDFRRVLTSYPSVALKVLDLTVEQRIAYTLLKLGEKLGEPSAEGLLIQMPFSREDLAGMTGTTTATASRVMSHLQKTGLINTGRQWVAIRDEAGLRAIAEEVPA